MMSWTHSRAVFCFGCIELTVGFCLCTDVIAQKYPDRPIRLVVAQTPGGSTDTVARFMARALTAPLGQQVIVDNRAGGGGNIGAELVAKASADGYTLILGTSSTFGVNPSLYPNIPYDAVKDFAPIIFVSVVPNVLVVPPVVPATSIQELVALAKAKPGSLNFASSGSGGGPHLAAELFKSQAGIDIVHIPYKGTGPAIADLLSAQVQLSFTTVVSVLPHIKSGKLRALAVTSPRRVQALPDVPTVAEAKFPGVNATSWNGMLAPARTPPAMIERINREANMILNSPQMRESLLSQGAEPMGGTPAEFGAYVRNEVSKWAKVVKAAGIKPE